MISALLFNETPLVVNPSLAKEIGLNNAIVLQQIHYWVKNKEKLKDKRTFKDGKYWVYNTIEEWQEQFPFFSESTIKRTLKDLKDKNLILVSKSDKDTWDRTNWYTVNYDAQSTEKQAFEPSGQNDPIEEVKMNRSTSGQNDPIEEVKMNRSIYSTEITTEITKNINKKEEIDYNFFLNHWNKLAREKGFPQVKKISHARKEKIKARFKLDKDFLNTFLEALKEAENFKQYVYESSWFNFDFLIKNENNILKVIEGNYRAKLAQGKGSYRQESYFERKEREIQEELNALQNQSEAIIETEVIGRSA